MKHITKYRNSMYVILLFVSAGIGFGVTIGWVSGTFDNVVQIWRNFTFPHSETARAYEDIYFRKLKYSEPRFEFRPHSKFVPFLREALGYDRIVLKAHLPHETSSFPYNEPHTGEELLSHYNEPPLTLRSFWSPGAQKADTLIVILPNWGSSAAKVMGYDNADFHLQLGYQAHQWGFDVGAIDTVSDVRMAASINMRLTMLGHQLNGLQAHHVCAAVSWQVKLKTYRRVILYGFGMGARLADFVAIVCPDVFNLVVLDGLPMPWRRFVWRQAITSTLKEHAIFQYNRPLLSDTSFLDFMGDDHVRKVYLITATDIARIRKVLEEYFLFSPALSQGKGAVLIKKEARKGLPDVQLLRTILLEEPLPDDAFRLRYRES